MTSSFSSLLGESKRKTKRVFIAFRPTKPGDPSFLITRRSLVRIQPPLLPGRLQTHPAPRFTNDAAERPRRRFRFLRLVPQRFADCRSTGPSLSFAPVHNPAASIGRRNRPDWLKVSPGLSWTAAGVIRRLSLLTERNRGGDDRDAVATVIQRPNRDQRAHWREARAHGVLPSAGSDPRGAAVYPRRDAASSTCASIPAFADRSRAVPLV